MKLFFTAFVTVTTFLFILWMLIAKDDFLDSEINNPFEAGK